MILEIVLIELAVALLNVAAWLTYRKFKPVVLNYRDRWHSMERSIVELKIDRDKQCEDLAGLWEAERHIVRSGKEVHSRLEGLDNIKRCYGDQIVWNENTSERLTKLEAGHSQTEKPVVKPKNWRGVKAELGEN